MKMGAGAHDEEFKIQELKNVACSLHPKADG
jgi:hypothetical protein